MLKLSANNPSSLKQPFLCLRIKKGTQILIWMIDVDGLIEKYLDKENKPTDLLVQLCRELAEGGYLPTEFGSYIGSFGPNYILRHGVLFKRQSEEFEGLSTGQVELINFQLPVYCQYW